MSVNLTDPIFTDEDKARAYFEAIRWPNGAVCPHCSNADSSRIYPIAANPARKIRAGLYECQECHGQFTVRTGSVMESSHVALTKWALAYRLMASAKKGISAHQLHRTIGVTYKTAWFMAHRIREAMRDISGEKIGGPDTITEADETYIGGKPRKSAGPSRGRKPGEPRRARGIGGRSTKRRVPVVALIERDGRALAKPTIDASAGTLSAIVRANVDLGGKLMTDSWRGYITVGQEFAGGHDRVDHGAGEYVQGDAHVNTAESFFALLKRGIVGSFHHVSEEHLSRYCDEFSFRWSLRNINDTDRTAQAIKAGEGKRLTYRNPRSEVAPET
jgi:transposase-like protein